MSSKKVISPRRSFAKGMQKENQTLNFSYVGPRIKRTGRRGETTTVVGNRVYFLGANEVSSFGGIYYMDSNSWEDLELPYSLSYRRYHTAVLAEDKMFIYGGERSAATFDSMIAFDTVLTSFTEITSHSRGEKSKGVSGATAVFTAWRREIIYFGGMQHSSNQPTENSIVSFNVDTLHWRKVKAKGNLPPPRSAHGAAVDLSKMYIFGGFAGFRSEDVYLGDLWIADLKHMSFATWSMVECRGNIPIGRTGACFNKFGQTLIVFGGYSFGGNLTDSMHMFLGSSSEWAKVPGNSVKLTGSFPTVRCLYSVDIADGVLYFSMGGVYKLTVGGES